MNPTSQDFDDQRDIRPHGNKSHYDERRSVLNTSNHQQSPEVRSSMGGKHDRFNDNESSPGVRRQLNTDHHTSEGKSRPSHDNNDGGSFGFRPESIGNSGADRDNLRTQNVHPQHNSSDQKYSASRVTVSPTKHTISGSSRSCVIDINITVNVGGRNSQGLVGANDVILRSRPIRSTVKFDDVRFIDLDIRSPQHTAELATDGLIRSPERTTRPTNGSSNYSSSQQSARLYRGNEND